jgi:hypothetical protein
MHRFPTKQNYIESNSVIKIIVIFHLDLQLPVQSVPITTDVVSWNLDQGEVYNTMW